MMIEPRFHNSATVMVPEWMVLGGGGWRRIPVAVRYGLFEHPALGLTLIDTGYGPQVTEAPDRSLPLRAYAAVLGIRLHPENSPLSVLAAMNRQPDDVSTILVSHFHADHVARLAEFPRARLMASGSGYASLCRQGVLRQVHNGVFGELLPSDMADRLVPFESSDVIRHPLFGDMRDLCGDGSCFAIDLPGHAIGHTAFLFPRLARPLLYAVDVQWHWQAIAQDRLPGLPASAVYSDRSQAISSVLKVREFARLGGRVVLCHDPVAGPHGLEVG